MLLCSVPALGYNRLGIQLGVRNIKAEELRLQCGNIALNPVRDEPLMTMSGCKCLETAHLRNFQQGRHKQVWLT